MTPVHQKPLHCAIACLLSAQVDAWLYDQQTTLATEFAADCKFANDPEGVVVAPEGFSLLAERMGLGKTQWNLDSNNVVKLLKGYRGRNIGSGYFYFLQTTHPTSHTVRINRILNRGIEVMDPEFGRFVIWDWKRVKRARCWYAKISRNTNPPS